MTADAKLLADMDALVAYMTDKTGKMPMPEVCNIPGTMRRGADALRRYVQGEDSKPPDWLVIDAVRYAIGRQSYQVGVTCRWLVENWERIPASAKTIIREDLERAFDQDTRQRTHSGHLGFFKLGSDIDRREWLAVINLARCSPSDINRD